MFSTAVAAVLCLLAVTARAQCPLQPLDPTSFNALKTSTGWSKITDALQKVDAAAAQFAKDNVGSGLAVVVTYQDTLVHQSSVGFARANIVPDYNRTIWRIASITKVFTALQLLQLADRDVVHLDSAITDLVPTLTSVPGITLRSLATDERNGARGPTPVPRGRLGLCLHDGANDTGTQQTASVVETQSSSGLFQPRFQFIGACVGKRLWRQKVRTTWHAQLGF